MLSYLTVGIVYVAEKGAVILLCCAVLCCAVLCCAVLCCAVLCCARVARFCMAVKPLLRIFLLFTRQRPALQALPSARWNAVNSL